MNEIPIKAYAVSAFVLKREGDAWKVLLLRRVGAGRLGATWGQIGGAIEAGETAWEAALREIREEANLVPDRFYSADVCEQFYEAYAECVCIMPVFVAFLDSEQPVVLSEEHSDYRWLTFDEADARLPFAEQRAALRHVEQEFIHRASNESLRLPMP